MKKPFLSLLAVLSLMTGCQTVSKPETIDTARIVANPVNLNYRFQPEGTPRREAADPVCEYFNGKYYLFASKSGGYWSSTDLATWKYIPCKTITTIEDYAPTILQYKGMLYFLASGGHPQIFRNANPDEDKWEAIDTKFTYGNTDPCFFADDDGKVYLYWGCSDKDPIVGVQVDPEDGFKALGTPDTLITHNYKLYGWEEKGDNNDLGKDGYNEGPCMIKHKGRYYLQYAAPGTEVRVYGDGVYTSDRPLGPYTYQESNPFSFKPGGFIGGAGHGYTFRDKYGNYWHIATMKVSIRHMFERRLGLFPVYMGDDDRMYAHTVLTDYPFRIPDGKADFGKDDLSMGWNLLSYRKAATASSTQIGYEPDLACDEKVETWWAASTGNAGEWWQTDLGDVKTIDAIQVNFADQGFTNTAANSYVNYRYRIEASADGKDWQQIADRTQNTKDMPHELIVLKQTQQARYLRITNTGQLEGKFSISDFRVFGKGDGQLPAPASNVNITRNRDDRRMISFAFGKEKETTGYIINYGVKADKLNNAVMLFDDEAVYRFFNRDSKYFFRVDTFNENGVTRGKRIITLN